MKKVFVFMGLKIIETLALVVLMYWFWWIGGWFDKIWQIPYEHAWYEQIISGIVFHFFIIGCCAIAFMISLGIYCLIQLNRKWTNKILRKL